MKSLKSILILAVLVTGLAGLAQAQENAATTETAPATPTTVAETIPAEAIPAELAPVAQELGCDTRTECAAAFDSNFDTALEIAIRHDVYRDDPTKADLAKTYRDEVLAKIQSAGPGDIDEAIIAIARDLIAKKPALARKMDLQKSEVTAAETIVKEVKNAGMSMDVCGQPEESLEREQLIACLKAAKNLAQKASTLEKYVPKGRIEGVEAIDVDQLGSLDASLAGGEYPQLGRVTAEEAGFQCLRSGSENLNDCDRIAEKFFGPEGVQMLQNARAGTKQVKEYYEQGIDKMSLKLSDGRKIVGRTAIKSQCDGAFESGNLDVARACGELAVNTGMATQEEMERGLKMLESFATKSQGQNIKFDECRFNPRACEEFLPDDFRGRYQAEQEIFQVMSASIGFDPQQCEFASDPEIGLKCLEGSQKALPEIEKIAERSPEARFIVDDIKRHIADGERMAEKMKNFIAPPPLPPGMEGQISTFQFSGPGGCSSPQACFNYCSDSSHAAECIAFGAQQNIFQGDEAVRRFQQVTDRFSSAPQFGRQDQFGRQGQFNQDQFGQFPGTGPYPGFQPGYYPPGQMPGFTEPGKGFGSIGPSPACFEAIQKGDFSRAKEVCQSFIPPPVEPQTPYPICPNVIPSPCPQGTYRQETALYNGCPGFGACVPIPDYQPPPKDWIGICPSLPTVTDCPAGQRKVVTFSSPQCGEYYACQPSETPTPGGVVFPYRFSDGYQANDYASARSYCYQWGPGSGRGIAGECESRFGVVYQTKTCPPDQYWDPVSWSCLSSALTTCPSGSRWDSGSQSCKSSSYGQCDWATQYWKSSTNNCAPKSNCTDTTSPDYNTSECQGVRAANNTSFTGNCPADVAALLGSGCHVMAGAYFNGEMNKYVVIGGTAVAQCSSTTWFQGCTGGLSVQQCLAGQYWNGTACADSAASSCPSNIATLLGSSCHSMSVGYFNGEMTSYVLFGGTAVNSCSTAPVNGCSGGTTTTTGSCPAGYHYHSESGSFCMNDQENYSGTCYNTSGTAVISCPQQTYNNCPSGQWWNGTSCTSTSTGTGTCPSGQWWYTPSSGGAGYCTSTTSGGCPSGQYWNGTSCVNNTDPSAACTQAGGTWNSSTNFCQMPISGSGTCPSGQYWYVPPGSTSGSCVSSGTTGGTDSATACANAGGSWQASTNYCQMPTTGGSGSCTSGQYWNGTACVNTTTCSSGQYWNGTACVSSDTSGGGGGGGGTTCSSGQYWNGSACVNTDTSGGGGGGGTQCSSGQWWDSATNSCQSSTSGGGGGGGGGTPCPSGQYWDGTACVATTSFLCQISNGFWTGGACDFTGVSKARLARQSGGPGLLAQVFRALFGRR